MQGVYQTTDEQALTTEDGATIVVAIQKNEARYTAGCCATVLVSMQIACGWIPVGFFTVPVGRVAHRRLFVLLAALPQRCLTCTTASGQGDDAARVIVRMHAPGRV